jgi:hypothetical protein
MYGETNVLYHISFLEQSLYETTKEFAPTWNSTRKWFCCTRHVVNEAYKQNKIPTQHILKSLSWEYARLVNAYSELRDVMRQQSTVKSRDRIVTAINRLFALLIQYQNLRTQQINWLSSSIYTSLTYLKTQLIFTLITTELVTNCNMCHFL